MTLTTTKQRKPTHGTYPLIRRPATAVRPGLHRSDLRTFVEIVAGWILSQRHRFITELIFASGHVGNGHWSRFHRFFSHAAWDLDDFSMVLAKLVVTILAPGATSSGPSMTPSAEARPDPLRGRHALRPTDLQPQALVSWGHDWVVLCLIIIHPLSAPTKVFALPVAARLYRNRQGLTKGRKEGEIVPGPDQGQNPKPDPNHRTRPELALELIGLAASWFPHDETIVVTGDSAYGGQSVLSHLPDNVHLISHVHPKAALYELAPPRQPGQSGGASARRGTVCPAWPRGPRTRSNRGPN